MINVSPLPRPDARPDQEELLRALAVFSLLAGETVRIAACKTQRLDRKDR
jgi:hypothetical protein